MNAEDGNSVFRSGFVAIVGKPNAGKSTLLNSLVGIKTSITSPKPQTTRHRILGVKSGSGYQIVFVDTPGVRTAKNELDRFMVKIYTDESRHADIILLVVDGSRPYNDEDLMAFDIIRRNRNPSQKLLLVINKIDLLNAAMPPAGSRNHHVPDSFDGVFPISALRGQGTGELESAIAAMLPPGPEYFPPDMKTDQSPEMIAAEVVREKVLMKTRQEIPHGVFVHTEEMREGINKGDLYFRIEIFVERESHKGILIGKGGKKLKEIGMLARHELEATLGCNVYLDLWVKIKEKWKDRKDLLRSWGYDL